MSHQVRLDDDVYEHIKSRKRDDETFSEAIERLTGAWTLLDFAEGDAVIDAAAHREILEQAERQSSDDTRARLERMGVEVDE
jgi:predicted CopG family antitoxin